MENVLGDKTGGVLSFVVEIYSKEKHVA